MDAMNNMIVCKRVTKYKYQWIQFPTNQLVLAIIILAVCGNTFILYNVNALENKPNNTLDCATYSTCRQCSNVSTCTWSFENQLCGDSDRNFVSNPTEDSCPKIALSIKNNYTEHTLNVTISEGEEKLKKFLDEQKIECEVDNNLYDVKVENNRTIICNYNVSSGIIDLHTNRRAKLEKNPLLIVYFSIISDDKVRLKFDKVQDHYVAVYPFVSLSNGTSCTIESNCTTAFWNDGPNQYYCKWCLENKNCFTTLQEGNCYVKNTMNNTGYMVENGSVVHVKGDDVQILDFSPLEGPATGGTKVTVTVSGHRVLAGVYDRTVVKVADRECWNPETQVGSEEITCTVANMTEATAADVRGPVVVTYLSSVQPTIELNSANASFRLVQNRIDGPTCGRQQPFVEPEQTFVGFASGGTRLTVRGRFECVQNPLLYVLSNGIPQYSTNCKVVPNYTELLCDAPKLPDASNVTTDLPVGFQWTFGGYSVNATPQSGHYELRPDPVFTHVQMGDGGDDLDHLVVTIHGQNADFVQPYEMSVRLYLGSPDGDASYKCDVQQVNRTSVTCLVNSMSSNSGNWSIADAKTLSIAVGRNLNRTLELKRSDVIDHGDEPERLLSSAVLPVGIFSGFITIVLALLLLVKLAITRSRQNSKKRYLRRLRDITAGVDEDEF